MLDFAHVFARALNNVAHVGARARNNVAHESARTRNHNVAHESARTRNSRTSYVANVPAYGITVCLCRSVSTYGVCPSPGGPSQTFGLFLCNTAAPDVAPFCRPQLFHNTTAILAVQSPTGLLLVLLTRTLFPLHIFHMSCPPRTAEALDNVSASEMQRVWRLVHPPFPFQAQGLPWVMS
eukprot:scaffold114210_cov55-Attheya_sp.AAC.1